MGQNSKEARVGRVEEARKESLEKTEREQGQNRYGLADIGVNLTFIPSEMETRFLGEGFICSFLHVTWLVLC
jgi:hypothetical protein